MGQNVIKRKRHLEVTSLGNINYLLMFQIGTVFQARRSGGLLNAAHMFICCSVSPSVGGFDKYFISARRKLSIVFLFSSWACLEDFLFPQTDLHTGEHTPHNTM